MTPASLTAFLHAVTATDTSSPDALDAPTSERSSVLVAVSTLVTARDAVAERRLQLGQPLGARSSTIAV
jgi:hypothetical protein